MMYVLEIFDLIFGVKSSNKWWDMCSNQKNEVFKAFYKYFFFKTRIFPVPVE